jgi:precorrin-4/cobalt-precorrin-4 C11-methyltransferase
MLRRDRFPSGPLIDPVPSGPDHLPAAVKPGTPVRRPARPGARLAIHLSIHTLDRVRRELLPFYGEDCPISVIYGRNYLEAKVVQGTLAKIEYRTIDSLKDSMLVLVG